LKYKGLYPYEVSLAYLLYFLSNDRIQIALDIQRDRRTGEKLNGMHTL
jgi:hypothetical protein